MMNKLKSSHSLGLNRPFWRKILINNNKNLKDTSYLFLHTTERSSYSVIFLL